MYGCLLVVVRTVFTRTYTLQRGCTDLSTAASSAPPSRRQTSPAAPLHPSFLHTFTHNSGISYPSSPLPLPLPKPHLLCRLHRCSCSPSICEVYCMHEKKDAKITESRKYARRFSPLLDVLCRRRRPLAFLVQLSVSCFQSPCCQLICF